MKKIVKYRSSLGIAIMMLLIGSCKKEPKEPLEILKASYRTEENVPQAAIEKLMRVGMPPKVCYYYFPYIEFTIGYPTGTDPKVLDQLVLLVQEELSKASRLLYLNRQLALNAYQTAQYNAFALVTGAGFNYYPPTLVEPNELCPGDEGYMTIVDPCFQKILVGNMVRDSIISAQNANILTQTINNNVEYGVEIKLESPISFSDYKPVTVRTDNSANSFNPKFTWNATDGYTVGAAHGHPSNSAPSPADAIWLVSNINKTDLRNASTDEKIFFKGNVSLTVVTTFYTYVITVNNWPELERLYFKYKEDEKAFNQKYIELVENNNNSSELALLSLFEGAINLYRAPAGSSEFKPRNIAYNGTRFIVEETPCP